MSDGDKLPDDVRVAALVKNGYDADKALAIIEVLDLDDNARFENTYRRHFQTGQFEGAMMRGRNSEIEKDHRNFAMAAESANAGNMRRLADVIEAVARSRWTSSYANHVICGHLLVAALLVMNLLAKYAGGWSMAGAGVWFAFFAYVCAYFGEANSHLPKMRRTWYWLCFVCVTVSAVSAFWFTILR